MEHRRRLTPESFWAHEDQLMERVRRAAQTVPVFTVRAWSGPVVLGDWQWQDDRLVSAGLVHGDLLGDGLRVEVVTTGQNPRETLVSLLGHDRWVPGTSAEDIVRRREEELAAPPTGVCVLDVAGADVRFDLWEDGGRWGAVGRVGSHVVVVAARTVPLEGLALDRVVDLEPFIAGRDAQIRDARGGS